MVAGWGQPLLNGAVSGIQPAVGAARMSTVVDHAKASTWPSPPPPAPSSHEDIQQKQRERAKAILREAVAAEAPRHDWTKEEISAIYYQPLMELTFQAVSHPREPL